MSIRKYFLTIVLILTLATQIKAQWSLWVTDPQLTWQNYQGTIEDATFSIGQKGLYSQVSTYLTFSARGSSFSTNNPLEIVYNFELPEGSFVTDLWLWIGDKISKGKIMDLWSASQIYESIVNRRQDPAILKKTGTKSYQLRVYPMGKNETRKVRVTYMIPVAWYDSGVTIPIPLELLKVSKYKTPHVSLITWMNSDWHNPRVLGTTSAFYKYSDLFYGDHLKMDLSDSPVNAAYTLDFDNPMIGGVFFKYYKQAKEGFYQLAVMPGNSIGTMARNILFLIDYDLRKSTTTRGTILTSLKGLVKSNLSATDNFNVMYSGLNIGKGSENWVNADQFNIDRIFGSINENSISTYSNLPALIKEGCDFINKKGAVGTICLISNSDQIGNNITANQLISDIRNSMGANYPIFIFDYNDKDYVYYYFNNRSYTGNEYFYDNLSRLTGGVYQRISPGNFSASLNDLLSKINGTINSFDLYTSLQNGFCYSRHTLNSKGETVIANKPITQIGKYIGDFPFVIKTSGIYNSTPFTQTMVISDALNKEGEEVIPKTWANNYINTLTNFNITNSVINEIINVSRNHQILTSYTAFLALENDTSWCTTCYKDDGKPIGATGVEENLEIPTEFSIDAYPNPFNSQVTITIKLPNNLIGQKLSFKIYNMLGQLVKTFSIDEVQNKNVVRLFWDGKNDSGEIISSGIYLFTVSGAKIVKSMKLMYMK